MALVLKTGIITGAITLVVRLQSFFSLLVISSMQEFHYEVLTVVCSFCQMREGITAMFFCARLA
jgi:hypothetical protein